MSICRILLYSFIILTLPGVVKANTILVLGDSLSAAYGIELEQGWVNLLQKKLDKMQSSDNKWHIINASITGETTAGGLARLPGLLNEHTPELCIIELGANDGLRGQSISRMQNHLNEIISQCKKYGEVLLLGIRLPPNYGKKYTESFDQSFVSLAEKNNIPLVPFILDGIALEEQYMQVDGLHPTAEAQAIILSNVWSSLKQILNTF